MKKYLLILSVAALSLFAASCEKTTEGVTEIISYFQMNGASSMYLGVGDTFEDPGYTELEGGGTVSTVITDMNGTVVDAVSTEAPGFFSIYYSTTNDQGLAFTKKRMVYIYDATVTETLGKFTVDGDNSYYLKVSDGSLVTNGTYAQWAGLYASNYGRTTNPNPTVEFKQVAGNIYTCSDLLGGWYAWIQGRYMQYSGAYQWAMTGYVTLNADMTLTLLSSYIDTWGDGLDWIDGSEYDPETGRLSYTWSYASQIYGYVEMVQ